MKNVMAGLAKDVAWLVPTAGRLVARISGSKPKLSTTGAVFLKLVMNASVVAEDAGSTSQTGLHWMQEVNTAVDAKGILNQRPIQQIGAEVDHVHRYQSRIIIIKLRQ